MKHFMVALLPLLFFVNAANAGQCYRAYKESQKLENMLEGVDYTSETDDIWHGFASWVPVEEITESEIRRVLRLGDTFQGVTVEDGVHFTMRGSERALQFLDWEIESFGPENYDDPEPAEKLAKLREYIVEKYGDDIRLIKFGEGDGDSYFYGYHMIVMIDKQGCVLGVKAITVWT